ncbi:MAG: hypothetical protein KA978_13260 [Deltaproteobacteria bacterium]|nr:hypothetical protein [Deltaproteobacteria bacterium]
MTNHRSTRALTGMLLSAAVGCAGSNALHTRFSAVHNTLTTMGVSQLGALSEGSLAEGATARFPVELDARCHTFVAFGDGARDVELNVLDANNQRVAGDSTRDAQATVQFCPTVRGRYTLALRMAEGGGGYLLANWRGGTNASGAAGAAGEGGPGSCATAIPITPGQTVTGDTRRGQSHNDGSCTGVEEGETGAPELVYALTLERRQQVTIAIEQSGFDGTVYVRSGGCEDPSSEAAGGCNDDEGDTSHSRLVLALDPGTHYIFVDGFARNAGNFSMTVTAADVPSIADVCQSAAALTPNTAVTGTLTSQDLNLFQARCGGNARGPDRVYRLEVPQESRLQLHQESDYDGVIHFRRACAEAGTEVDCNDDAEDVQHARINAIVPAGTYFVFTDGYAPNAAGAYTLQADLAPVAGGNTAGDTCADAQLLTPGTPVDGNTFQARDDVHSPCAAAADGYDVVYRLNVTARSRVKLWFDSNDLREQGTITVARACDGAPLTQATCHPGAIGEARAYDQVLDPGNYYVIVDSAAPRRFGRFRLNSRVESAAEVERLCRTAPLLVPGRTVTGTTVGGTDRFQASCAGGARSPENLYRLVVRRRSAVRVSVTSTTSGYDPAVFIRQTCAQSTTERGCNDDAGDVQHSQVEATLEPGTYTVFVDGYANRNSGAYSLECQVTPQ